MLNNCKNILIVAAHPDDEVLGCGATIARLASEGIKVTVLLLGEGPLSRFPQSNEENGSKALERNHAMDSAQKAATILGVEKCITAGTNSFHGFPDNCFDTVPFIDIVKFIEKVAAEVQPDAVFTHHAGDLNIDHRITHQATMTAFRPLPDSIVKVICGFEVLSSTEYSPAGTLPPFEPTLNVEVSNFMQKKLDALKAYDSEMRPFPHPRSYEAVDYLGALRGAQCGKSRVESFICYRWIV